MPTPPFLNKVAKGAFLSKVCPPIYAAVHVHAVMLSKKQQRSSVKADMHHCCLRKQAHDKRGIAESLHAQIARARLTLRIFERNITTLENTPTSLFLEPLKFIAHGRIFERLRYIRRKNICCVYFNTPSLYYHNLLKVRQWVINLSGSSKRGVDIFRKL